MADLGNLFFSMRIKDMTDEDFKKLEKKLEQRGMKIKLTASNIDQFIKDLQTQIRSKTLNINVKPIGVGSTGATTTAADLRHQRMLEVQQRMANAAALAQQRLANAQAAGQRATERHNASMLRGNSIMGNQSRLAGQLQNQLLNIYSVYQAERFVRSLIEIGGEFQKQHIALNAMLGDAAKADKIFGQIKGLAVESPFNFRELMGFTKQIAAFGIPYEEMYETTKRLADISAGLGVDMGRIILAYGQVRSAAFLRGQELRQFTEAGIPLVDELAKKFTELEGRVVSAGEVFEKISKREVSFGMVKDILWELTNEGGKFYNMQEVLTESLSGKLAKLVDSYEMMLGTIAESNNEILGGGLDMLTAFTDKWRVFLNALLSIIAAYYTYKGVMMTASALRARAISHEIALTGAVNANTIATYANNMAQNKVNQGAIRLLTNLQKLKMAFSSLGAAGWTGILIAGVVALGTAVYNTSKEAARLRKELDDIGEKGALSVQNEIDGYKILIEKLDDAVEGTQEYNDILNKIQSNYGNYIGNIENEARAYEYLRGKIDAVSEALRNKARESARQQMMSSIEDKYSSNISESMKTIVEELKQNVRIKNEDTEELSPISDRQAKEIASIIRTRLQDAVKNGLDPRFMRYDIIKGQIETIGSELGLALSLKDAKKVDVSGRGDYYNFGGLANAAKGVKNLAKTFKLYNNDIAYANEQLDLMFKNTTSYGVIMEKIQKQRDELYKSTKFKDESEKIKFEIETYKQQINAIQGIAGSGDAIQNLKAEIAELSKVEAEWRTIAKEKFSAYVGLQPAVDEKSIDYLSRLRKEYKSLEEISKESLEPGDKNDALKRMQAIKSFMDEYNKSLDSSNSDINSYSDKMNRVIELREKGTRERIQMETDLENQAAQARINAMKDGFEKEQAQRNLDNKKELQALEKQKNDYINKVKELARKVFEAEEDAKAEKDKNYKKKSFDPSSVSVDTSIFGMIENYTKERQINETAQFYKDILSKYQGYISKRLEAERKFKEDRERLEKAGAGKEDLQELEYQRNKALAAIDMEFAERETSFQAWADGIANLSLKKLQQLLIAASQELERMEFLNPNNPNLAVQRAKVNVLREKLPKPGDKEDTSPDKRSVKDWQELYKVLSKVEKEFDEIGDAVGGTVGDVISAAGSITATTLSMINSIISLGTISADNIKGVSEATAQAIATVEKASVILAIASAALQIATKIMNFFGGDNSTEKYEEAEKIYDAYIQTMDKVIEKQLELAEALSGENARAAYKQAVDMIEAQTEAARELGQMYLSSGGSWKSHTAGYNEVKDMSWEGWVQAAKALGMSVDQFRNLMGGRMSGLFELTAEQLSELQEQAPSFWAQLDEDTRKYAEQIADSIEDIAEVTEQKMENATGVAWDSFSDDILESLYDVEKGAEDIADDMSEYMRKALIKAMYVENYMPEMRKWYEKWANYMSDGVLSDYESKELDSIKNNLIDQMVKEAEAINKQWGTNSSGGSGLSAGIKGITEDQADLLASYANAMRSDLSAIRLLLEQRFANYPQEQRGKIENAVSNYYQNGGTIDYNTVLNNITVYLDEHSGLMERSNILAESQLTYLKSIADNTKRTADSNDKIKEAVEETRDMIHGARTDKSRGLYVR